MNSRRTSLIAATLAILAIGAALASSASAGAPVWSVLIRTAPTNFPSGYSLNEGGLPNYGILLTNVGAAPSSGPVTVTVSLPPGISQHGTGQQVVNLSLSNFSASGGSVEPGKTYSATVHVDVGSLPDGPAGPATVVVSGGGAASVEASTSTTIAAGTPFSTPPPFDFIPGAAGVSASINDADGFAVTQAGSHPYAVNFDLGFPSQQIYNKDDGSGEQLGVEGGVRDARNFFQKGMVINPDATPVRCTEVQLETNGCPDASAVGTIDVISGFLGGSDLVPYSSSLFSMVPAVGEAAQFGFEPSGQGIYIHVVAGLRAGDYAPAANTTDIISLFGVQIYGARVQLWGDPSSPSHDLVRGKCIFSEGEICPVPPQETPLISMPSKCGGSLSLEAEADSWSNPGAFHHRSTAFLDTSGNEPGVTGCNALQFKPSLEARPTTNVADSPSGLHFDLKVPQTESLNTLATAHLRKAVVTLPTGMALNPSSANGLGACSPAQVGIDPSTGVPNGAPVACPDNSKVGTVEVDNPLTANPLVGAVYVAKPYDNPFNSLLAIYITVDDPATGILVKLAGKVTADPSSGRLTTTFDENPQLPFRRFTINLFGGASATLRTPETCGTYSTTSSLTPWSAPDSGPPASPSDSYSITRGPGGSCASSQSALSSSSSFDAGSASAIAGKHAPFVLHLRRNDGSQRFSAVDVSPPPGLTAKLAGTAPCSDSALAAAAQQSGAQEQTSPSCPASSEVGSYVAGAGAGPAPYYAPGKVYLAGPYNGAPLSFAFITPAIAGPYDLGTLVTRAAVYLDAATGRVTTVSDSLPTILQGIPLDIRSLDVSLDRPDFALNGTSCDPLSVDGHLTSTLGQVLPLSSRFQLAECGSLAFRPKLAIHLSGGTKRGAHPALRGVVQMPEGGANIAQASVALPHSEFLDQGHIGTVCTRVQFAQGDGNGSACPAGSVYGHAVAMSPLVGYALEGPAILRSSSHELPDLVIALHGPPYQPVQVDVVGRIDSIHGGIRTTFEDIPDLPVSKFVLSMQGAKKGLLQNSTDICKGTHLATGDFDAQNGAATELDPALRNSKCRKAKRPRRKHRHHATR